MQRSLWTRLKGRKFLSVVAYVAFVAAGDIFNWPISYESYKLIAAGLGLFVIGESYIDGKAASK